MSGLFCCENREKKAVGKQKKESMYTISLKLSESCLEVVCAGIYFDLPNGGYSLSTCLSTKGVLSYLKLHKP